MKFLRILSVAVFTALCLVGNAAAGEVEDYLALTAFRDAGARAEFYAQAETFLQKHPASEKAPEIMFLLGEAESDLFAATERFTKIVEKYPSSPFAPKSLYSAGQVYYLYNDYNAAAQKFGLLIEKYPDFPMCAEAQLWKARSELAANRTAEARQTAAPLIEQAAYPSLAFQAKLIEPAALFQEDKYEQAAESCLKLLPEATNGQLPPLLLLLADSLLRAGQGDRAAQYYSRIVHEFPNSPEATNATMALR